jgi:hypothetical protein
VITASLEEAGAAAIAPVVEEKKPQNSNFNKGDRSCEAAMA